MTKNARPSSLGRTFLFRPTVAAIWVGRLLADLSDTRTGRVLVRPLLALMARSILYAKSLPIVRPRSQFAVTHDALTELLSSAEEIAVIPCACRAASRSCSHPLHGEHEAETCISVGVTALLQRFTGVGRRISREEALRICERAAESGMVHHALISLGILAELCNCCAESCAIIRASRKGVRNIVRPADVRPFRTGACTGCAGKDGRACARICPYVAGPGSAGCVGCGLCALHCPNKAIEMRNDANSEGVRRRHALSNR